MFTNIGRFPLDNLKMFGTKLKIWILFGLAHSVNTSDLFTLVEFPEGTSSSLSEKIGTYLGNV